MSCPRPEQIAAAASGHEDPRLLEHAEACVACGHELAEQRELRAQLAALAAPALPRARRDALAAEVMARADALPERHYRRWLTPALAAAAAAVLAYAASEPIQQLEVSGPDTLASATRTPDASGQRTRDRSEPRTSDTSGPARTADGRTGGAESDDRTDVAASDGTRVRIALQSTALSPRSGTSDGGTANRPATIAGANARFTRDHANGRDVVDLRDGEITIDTRSAAPVEIPLGGGANVRVAQAKVTVRAQRGVIQSVTVFAGSAQVTASGRHQRIEAGTIWHRDTLATPEPTPVGPPPLPPVPPIDARGAASAFREGWEALRAGRYSDAIAAFDRASDPVVAEDAAYWAAIAAERAGDRDAAIHRLTDFLAAFPDSPRADAARAALAKLGR